MASGQAAGDVLVVEDDPQVRDVLTIGLSRAGFRPSSATTAEEGLATFMRTRPDAVLVDLRLPGMDGFRLCELLRAVSDVPIIIVSGLRNEEQIVRGLEAGADDYVTKPFSVEVVGARLRAQLRRERPAQPAQPLVFGGGWLVVDLAGRRVERDGVQVRLSPTELRLLSCLVMNAGRMVPHRDLAAWVWGADAPRLGRYLRIHVARIRQKIEPDASHPRFLTARHGAGYVFEAETPGRPAAHPDDGAR